VPAWEYVTVKLTESGLTQQKPSKVGDDVPDSIKSIVCWWGQEPTPLTKQEVTFQEMPEQYKNYLFIVNNVKIADTMHTITPKSWRRLTKIHHAAPYHYVDVVGRRH